MRETWVQSLGREALLEKAMAPHSSILAWKTLWIEEPGRLQSMGSQRLRHNWMTSLSFFQCSVKQIHPAVHLCCMCFIYEYYISIKSLGVCKCVCVYTPSEGCCNISLYDTFALFSLPDKCVYTHTHTLYCCLVAKSCPTLCDPMDCSTPGFPVFH